MLLNSRINKINQDKYGLVDQPCQLKCGSKKLIGSYL